MISETRIRRIHCHISTTERILLTCLIFSIALCVLLLTLLIKCSSNKPLSIRDQFISHRYKGNRHIENEQSHNLVNNQQQLNKVTVNNQDTSKQKKKNATIITTTTIEPTVTNDKKVNVTTEKQLTTLKNVLLTTMQTTQQLNDNNSTTTKATTVAVNNIGSISTVPPNYLNNEDKITIQGIEDIKIEQLRLITRSEWLADPPVRRAPFIQIPVPYVIIYHTFTGNCSTLKTCMAIVQNIQRDHLSRKYLDIGYNFLIGGDGNAYIGRGWTYIGAHLATYNRKSIGIAFIGNFEDTTPSKRQIIAAQRLIKQGEELEILSKDYKILGTCQLSNTRSPGKFLFDEIKTWDHWVKEP